MKWLKTKNLFFFTTILLVHINYAQNSIPLSLNAAIDLAFNKNAGITIANYQVNTSEFALKEAKGNFLPKLYLHADYNRNIDWQVIFLPNGLVL